MPQSVVRNGVHLVFSTKHREPFITPDLAPRFHTYLAGTLRGIDCPAIMVGGHVDHVHILFLLAKTVPICKAVEEVKKESSKWAKEHVHPRFYWQSGYGAFSVSPPNEVQVTAYIARQEEHHKTTTFQDEFRDLLRKHGIEWDERYAWD